jgi:hypothetical protein
MTIPTTVIGVATPDWQQAGFRVNAILWSFGVNTGGEILERVAGESTEDEANGRSEAKVA